MYMQELESTGRVFGVGLEDLVAREPSSTDIPIFLKAAVEFLFREGMHCCG